MEMFATKDLLKGLSAHGFTGSVDDLDKLIHDAQCAHRERAALAWWKKTRHAKELLNALFAHARKHKRHMSARSMPHTRLIFVDSEVPPSSFPRVHRTPLRVTQINFIDKGFVLSFSRDGENVSRRVCAWGGSIMGKKLGELHR